MNLYLKKLINKVTYFATSLVLSVFFLITYSSTEVTAIRFFMFPVVGSVQYSNDYDAPRSNGPHHAIDIIGHKHQKLVSVVNGTIVHVAYPEPSWGFSVTIRDDSGWKYRYIHMNNDHPGTDDGKGDGYYAYAQDIEVGNRVNRGQLIGYIGDSGNAENTVSHVHFEMFKPGDEPVNPYWSLNRAQRTSSPVPGPELPNEVLPYGDRARLRVRLAIGDLDNNGDYEVITGGGPRWAPLVRIFDDGVNTKSFYAYEASFKGGIDVATGDIDGDGEDEIITARGEGGEPEIRIFESDGTQIGSFLAWGTIYKNGVEVDAGDIDNDGFDEIVAGVTKGIAHVRAFEPDGTMISNFYAHGTAFKGGVTVAAGDIEGDSADEIVTGIGAGGLPRIKVFDQSGTTLEDFYAYDKTYRNGVNVSVDNVRVNSSEEEIVTILSSNGPPLMKMFNYQGSSVSNTPIDTEMVAEEWWKEGFYDLAAGNNCSWGLISENRRPSIRFGLN